MGLRALEVADIFRLHGPSWRQAQHAHLSLGQLKVMSAIEQCRSAALGGHVLHCDACEQVEIAYNSCRNRHCPKCQASAARRWLEARQAELLPVPYYHVVFTLPAPVTFRWKDYRARGRTRYKTMTLEAHEFMRRFLLHVLPHGFHRIRHYGLIANAGRKANLARARELLQVVSDLPPAEAAVPATCGSAFICPHCGAAMRIIDTFARGQPIRAPPRQQGAV